jgi:hypothetical protein
VQHAEGPRRRDRRSPVSPASAASHRTAAAAPTIPSWLSVPVSADSGGTSDAGISR